ncbi:MAG: hypothetical protein AAB434_01425 [Planctomycetota bacterium]
MRIGTVTAVCILLIWMRPAESDTSKADALRAEGVSLFKAEKYAEAADRYRGAIDAYGEVQGRDGEEFLGNAVTLWRATAWCEVYSNDTDGLAAAYAAFYEALLALGGNEKEEGEIRNCLGHALREAAERKAVAEMEKIYLPFRAAVEKALERAEADPRGEAISHFSRRLINASMGSRCAWFEMLYLAGEKERGAKEYAEVIAFWRGRNDPQSAAWAAQNAFYDLADLGRIEDAGFFVVESLTAIRRDDLPRVEATLGVNLCDLLQKAHKDGNSAAITFLREVIEQGRKAKAFTPGLSETYFRLCLDECLREAPADRLTNAHALAALGREDGDLHVEAAADIAAGEALAATSKAGDAVARLDGAAARAERIGDLLSLGEARLAKGRTLSAAGKHADAEEAIQAAIEAFEKADDGVAAIHARSAGLANAKAKKDETLTAKYEEALSSISAAGGLAGRSIGDMEPEELVRRANGSANTIDLIEVWREGDRLVFKNLLDGTAAEDEIAFPFHNVKVSGALFQVRGPELLLENIYDGRGCPGAHGDVCMSMGGQVQASHGDDFAGFRLRLFLAEGTRIRVNSAYQMYRVRE